LTTSSGALDQLFRLARVSLSQVEFSQGCPAICAIASYWRESRQVILIASVFHSLAPHKGHRGLSAAASLARLLIGWLIIGAPANRAARGAEPQGAATLDHQTIPGLGRGLSLRYQPPEGKDMHNASYNYDITDLTRGPCTQRRCLSQGQIDPSLACLGSSTTAMLCVSFRAHRHR
jgi:hypothetical protein